MSSIDRPLAGDILIHDLEAERRRASNPDALKRSRRSARTLVKTADLRVTVVAVAAGTTIADHRVSTGVLIQPLKGTFRCTVHDAEHEVSPGELLFLGPDVPHSVSSDTGGAFLLTIGNPDP